MEQTDHLKEKQKKWEEHSRDVKEKYQALRSHYLKLKQIDSVRKIEEALSTASAKNQIEKILEEGRLEEQVWILGERLSDLST